VSTLPSESKHSEVIRQIGELPSSPALLPSERGEGSRPVSPSPVSDGPGTHEVGGGQGGEGRLEQGGEDSPQCGRRYSRP
jgi:hypothetical protein